ncbi:MAG: SDR family NAD(P)-dependent oxidoreductase [Candidatus Acidiferrales bacterium]
MEYANYPSLRDRVVVVTGGASGIGEKIVEQFAQQGAQVALVDIQNEAAAHLTHRLRTGGHTEPYFLQCDLTDVNALGDCMRGIVAKFKTVDVLVNNAANDTRHSIAEVTPEYWDQSIAVNLRHQFFASQAVIPVMKKAGRGSIINMSSICWMVPSVGMPVYVTAKAAIVGLTRTLAHELGADNIRVNCILPGAIFTERQKQLWFTKAYEAEILSRQALKRMIQPVEVARLVLFLAADDSNAITSQSYVIDAGWV